MFVSVAGFSELRLQEGVSLEAYLCPAVSVAGFSELRLQATPQTSSPSPRIVSVAGFSELRLQVQIPRRDDERRAFQLLVSLN